MNNVFTVFTPTFTRQFSLSNDLFSASYRCLLASRLNLLKVQLRDNFEVFITLRISNWTKRFFSHPPLSLQTYLHKYMEFRIHDFCATFTTNTTSGPCPNSPLGRTDIIYHVFNVSSCYRGYNSASPFTQIKS